MLGCQDFCGYYDWTFYYVHERFGRQALETLWAEAIGAESQNHYEEAGRREGLLGLLKTWQQTGEDEHCEWTFRLDEKRNVLRWDMRECPSKGFLLNNDLNSSVDYCDHCMGWIGPLLERIGVEVIGHEHNHCGQCWGEMSLKAKPHESLEMPGDIRKDPRWSRGYLNRWVNGRKLPMLPIAGNSPDPCDVLSEWFARTHDLVVLGRGPSAAESWGGEPPAEAVLVTDTTYATRDVFSGEPLGVLFSDHPADLAARAERFLATPPERRPLLMHMFLPGSPPAPFAAFGLPRPVPILPLLIREGYYMHRSGAPYPTTGVFLAMLAICLGKEVYIAGIDAYQHPSGKVYAAAGAPAGFALPARHSAECDLAHLRRALSKAKAPVHLPSNLRELLEK